jgi:hypothetical protein
MAEVAILGESMYSGDTTAPRMKCVIVKKKQKLV